MFLEEEVVLHVLGTATRFSAVSCLDAQGKFYSQSEERIRKDFLKGGCTMYTVRPNIMCTDQGCVLTSET